MKFVGFDPHAKGYRVSDGIRVTISREVKFTKPTKRSRNGSRATKTNPTVNEKEMNSDEEEEHLTFFPDEIFEFPRAQQEPHVEEEPQAEEEPHVEEEPQAEEEQNPESGNEQEDSFRSAGSSLDSESDTEEEEFVQPMPRRTARTTAGQLPSRFRDFAMQSHAMMVTTDPCTDKEAMESFEANQWEKAKKEELESIKRNKTWTVTELPHGRKAIGSKWVFKSKVSATGEKQYKARLVAQGFTQQFGIDFDEVFAPVANSTTLKILLTVAGMKSFHVRHYDVKSAFLNGELKEEIYMRPPPGVNENGKVYRLQKSLYGLKQAANVWNQKLHDTLTKTGSVRSKEDDCLYSYASGGVVIYLLVHVDDILAVSNSVPSLKNYMNIVGRAFEIKDLGEVKSYLGISLQRNEEGFFEMSQSEYIQKILEVTEMNDAKVSRIPMDTGYHKVEGEPLDSNDDYRKLIGMLLYLSVNSRPDIAAAVAILCQKVSAPTSNDLNEAKRVLRYLKGTKDLRLKMGSSNGKDELWAFTDSDWAEDKVNRKSNSGFVCFLSNSPVMWKSKKQTIVATSSAEAEYIALSSGAKEVIWIKRMIESFGLKQEKPTKMYSDSMSAIAMVTKPKSGSKSKHIDTKFHHVKDLVSNKVIELQYVPTERNVADVLTKPLGKNKMKQFRELLGFTKNSEIEEEC